MKANNHISARNTALAWVLAALCATGLQAQTIALKTNLLTGALSSPNIAVEVKLSERFSLEAGVHYNPFRTGEDSRWKHWYVQPGLRYWLCQPYGGHFVGVNFLYGVYNVGSVRLPFGILKEVRSARYEGEFTGAGLVYGYHFILSSRWSIEAELGIGFLHNSYEKYRCFHCGEKTGGGNKNFIAPTKAAVSLVYVIR